MSRAQDADQFEWTDAHLWLIREKPHVLGHLVGYDKLTDLHSQWILYVLDADEHRALRAHRGAYKSTAVAIVGSIWWMLFHPDDRILLIRKTFTDAKAAIDTIKSLMDTPVLKSLFAYVHGRPPKLIRSPAGILEYNFKQTRTPEGNINGFGLDSGLTGKHGDKVLIDDAITLKDRISKAARETTKEVLREIYTNIVDPGKPVGHIGTPWHREDYWAESPVTPLDFPVSATKLLSAKDIAEKKRTTTPFLYSLNYDLDVSANQDMLFKDPKFGRWSWMHGAPWAHLDAAFHGTHTCALTIMGECKAGAKAGEAVALQATGWIFAGNVKDWLPFVHKMYHRFRCRGILNENNPDKGYTADKLRDMGMNAVSYAERQNKGLKIASYLFEGWDRITWDQDTDPDYLNQILDWQEGNEPDDAPDSAATLLREKFITAKKTASHWKMAL